MAEKLDAEDKIVRKAIKSLNKYTARLLNDSVDSAGGWANPYPDFSKGVYHFVFPDGKGGLASFSCSFIKSEELDIHKNDPCPVCHGKLIAVFNSEFDHVPCLWCRNCRINYSVMDSKLCLSESS